MASSKDVLAVVGMCCINRKFRADFFNNPRGKAEYLVGKLKADEVEQLERIAGKADLPTGLSRTEYVNRLSDAFDAVFASCTCPRPPCPDDPETA